MTPRARRADTLPGSEAFHVDKGTSYDVLRAQRVYKTAKEVVFMRRMNRISSLAHMAVMRATVPGMHEFQMEALFRYFTYSLGAARNLAYTAICASGSRCATLHYGHAAEPNRHRLEDGTTVLNDMGAEYHCYASDITTCFPVNGTFTEQQRHVYDAVLDALWSVMGAMKPGVAWPDMHELAYQRILSTLVTMGVLKCAHAPPPARSRAARTPSLSVPPCPRSPLTHPALQGRRPGDDRRRHRRLLHAARPGPLDRAGHP